MATVDELAGIADVLNKQLDAIVGSLDTITEAIGKNTEALREIAVMLRVEDHDALDDIKHDPLIERDKECTLPTALVKALSRLRERLP